MNNFCKRIAKMLSAFSCKQADIHCIDKTMIDLSWLGKLEFKKYVAPFAIDRDNQYLPALKEKLHSLVNDFRLCSADPEFVKIAEYYAESLIQSVELYYKGCVIEAQNIVNHLVNEFEEGGVAISNINNSIAFPPSGENDRYSEVQFFRARLNDVVVDYPANEMLHIPFNCREIVKSERFSIPGLPCLYLANSTYACWIEMGRPADYRFNVSPIVLDNTQKILNLTVSIRDLCSLFSDNGTAPKLVPSHENILEMIKLVILNIATSYRVKQSGRNFRSEYILPQLIMLACKNRGLSGVSYYSKQVDDEIFAAIVGINVVLFPEYNGDDYSEICNHLQIGDSFNFSMYKQLLAGQTYKHYHLRIDNTPYINNVGTWKRQFPYKETEFYQFDKYLFAYWNRK